MQFSYSRVETFNNCPHKFKLRYLDKLKTIPNTDADNALLLGVAIHKGLETDAKTAIAEYVNSYPIITDEIINETIKMEFLIPKVKNLLPDGEYELPIITSDYLGFMDLLVKNEDGTYDLYDFKYSNNISNYMKSGQLHVYKYFYEQMTGRKIRKLFFVFVPKVAIKQKKTEDLLQFRERIKQELAKSQTSIREVEFDYSKVIDFTLNIKKVLECKDFEKNINNLCRWCEYKEHCQEGEDFMLLPKNERRNISEVGKKVIWLYGAPFSGKTFFANSFPEPLMLNTDGNIRFIDAPYISIKDIVNVEGRMTKRTLAWEVFKDVISELEKKQNDFKTIVLDLLEDVYEHCRLYMYEQMGITHESDDSFRAWDKVRTEFLSTMKRLMNLDYENIILISHEDTSKDITKKGGDKITAIKPNLQEKTSNKIAGMVDIVARVVADGEVRTLNFKSTEMVFGGGRLTVTSNTIPLEYDELMSVYNEANKGVVKATAKVETPKVETPISDPEPREPEEQPEQPTTVEVEQPTAEVKTRTRQRKPRE